MNYSFNTEIARLYGVHEAIFIQHLYWWIKTNEANNINFHEVEIETENGEKAVIKAYWEYNSMRAFSEIFPFWTQRQVRTTIKNCRKQGLIYASQFNKFKYDQTLWYTLSGKTLKIYGEESNLTEKSILNRPESQPSIDQEVQPIPINNPVSNPVINYSCCNSSSPNAEDFSNSDLESTSPTSNPTSSVAKKSRQNQAAFHHKSEPYMLAAYLEEGIQQHSPQVKENEANRQRWARDIDKMIRIDKLDPDDIAKVIKWCQQDKFWCCNILSGKKLREKYMQLDIKMRSEWR